MSTYYICGFNVHIDCISSDFIDMRCREYKKPLDFEFDNIADKDIYITSKAVNKIDDVDGKIIVDEPGNKVTYKDGKTYCVMGYQDINIMKVVYSENYKYTEIEINTSLLEEYSTLSLIDLEYMYIGGAFSVRVGLAGGIMIHSSCISYNGNGILFSAPSGTGKSTHTSLWKKVYGNKVQHINDDKPIIMFIGGKPYACGTPFSGKTDINSNIVVPMKVFVYLMRGSKNTISKIENATSLMYLTEQTIKTNIDKNVFLNNLDSIEKIIEQVPCYELHCLPNEDAVRVVEKEIFYEN